MSVGGAARWSVWLLAVAVGFGVAGQLMPTVGWMDLALGSALVFMVAAALATLVLSEPDDDRERRGGSTDLYAWVASGASTGASCVLAVQVVGVEVAALAFGMAAFLVLASGLCVLLVATVGWSVLRSGFGWME